MAVGDIITVWGAWTEVPWTANNQEGLSDATLTSAWSDELDLSAASVLDIAIFLKYKTAAGSLATNPYITVYVVGDANGTYPPVARANALPALTVRPNAANTQEYSNPYGVGAAFKHLPDQMKFGIYNATGLAFSATTDEVQLYYRALYQNIVQS